jgi:hypothetical protein
VAARTLTASIPNSAARAIAGSESNGNSKSQSPLCDVAITRLEQVWVALLCKVATRYHQQATLGGGRKKVYTMQEEGGGGGGT